MYTCTCNTYICCVQVGRLEVLELNTGMSLAEGLSRFDEKALTLQIFLAQLSLLIFRLESSDGMLFAKYSSSFGVKTLPLQVIFTHRAVEAL